VTANYEPQLTMASGSPVIDTQHSLTVGPGGPLLMQDRQLMEKLAHVNRERIPERIVHANGAGAYGEFECTNSDLAQWTAAKVFQFQPDPKDKKIKCFVRFSTVIGEPGTPESGRDVRGMAVRFYTQEGNYDLLCNNIPVFFIRDAMKFPDLIQAAIRNPQTGLRSTKHLVEFFAKNPESLLAVTMLHVGSIGRPLNYRSITAYSGHAFAWINAHNDVRWVRYKFSPHLDPSLGKNKGSTNPSGNLLRSDDASALDLYLTLQAHEEPSWDLEVQLLNPGQEKSLPYAFDPTLRWRPDSFQTVKVGTLRLKSNPRDFFTHVEQAAFSPGNLVPGIGISPDPLLHARIFAYQDAQHHRLGINHDQLPVNRPRVRTQTGYRGGAMRYEAEAPSTSAAEPETTSGHTPMTVDPAFPSAVSGLAARFPERGYGAQSPWKYHYEQVSELFERLGGAGGGNDPSQQRLLVENIAASLRETEDRKVQCGFIDILTQANQKFGEAVAKALDIDCQRRASRAVAVPMATRAMVDGGVSGRIGSSA
jgi:catalase